jgi:hypothetical protein
MVSMSLAGGWFRFHHRNWSKLTSIGPVALAALDADEDQIVEAAFCAAIPTETAKRQKSISLLKRAEATYAEYLSQKRKR